MENEYLDIMIQSLQKKAKVLDGILAKNQEQREILEREELDADALEKNMQEKSDLVDQINPLDEGFEELYARVKEVLDRERPKHTDEIAQMQRLIAEITEKSVSIQSGEARNRRLMETKFSQERKRALKKSMSSTVTRQYYQTMTKLNVVDAQFMDKKK